MGWNEYFWGPGTALKSPQATLLAYDLRHHPLQLYRHRRAQTGTFRAASVLYVGGMAEFSALLGCISRLLPVADDRLHVVHSASAVCVGLFWPNADPVPVGPSSPRELLQSSEVVHIPRRCSAIRRARSASSPAGGASQLESEVCDSGAGSQWRVSAIGRRHRPPLQGRGNHDQCS